MGQRGEIFSTRISIDEGSKTIFFNVKENRYQDVYINIVESRKTDQGFKRSSIVVFNEDLAKFMPLLEASVEALRGRRSVPARTLVVGGGRREYDFCSPQGRKHILQIIEKREDSTGRRRESVVIPAASIDSFMQALEKAIAALKA